MTLTPRQIEVLHLVAEGKTNLQIARELHLARPTAEAHVLRLLKRIGAVSRAHAVALGYQRGILRVEREAA